MIDYSVILFRSENCKMQPLVIKRRCFFLHQCVGQNDQLRYVVELCAKQVQLSHMYSELFLIVRY